MSCCNPCFSDWICGCIPYSGVLTVSSSMPLDATIDGVISSSNGHSWRAPAEISYGGDIELNIADFPAGIFNEYIGPLELKFYERDTWVLVPVPVMASYECIAIEVRGGNADKDFIGS